MKWFILAVAILFIIGMFIAIMGKKKKDVGCASIIALLLAIAGVFATFAMMVVNALHKWIIIHFKIEVTKFTVFLIVIGIYIVLSVLIPIIGLSISDKNENKDE